jgi:hypothetical protein
MMTLIDATDTEDHIQQLWRRRMVRARDFCKTSEYQGISLRFQRMARQK